MMVSVAVLLAGCQSAPIPPKTISTVGFFLEATAGGPDRNVEAKFTGAQPLTLSVDRIPFLTESDVARASIEEYVDAFAITIELTRHGALLLDSVSTANLGKRIAVFGSFGDARWIAASRISDRMAGGIFRFVPRDLTHKEAERFVEGLNAVSNFLDKEQLRY